MVIKKSFYTCVFCHWYAWLQRNKAPVVFHSLRTQGSWAESHPWAKNRPRTNTWPKPAVSFLPYWDPHSAINIQSVILVKTRQFIEDLNVKKGRSKSIKISSRYSCYTLTLWKVDSIHSIGFSEDGPNRSIHISIHHHLERNCQARSIACWWSQDDNPRSPTKWNTIKIINQNK